MIVITGANGRLGRGVVEALLKRRDAAGIAAAVRDPAGAAALAEAGVAVRRGDFADPDGLAAAFAGAERALIVSVDKLGEPAVRLHRAGIEAARAAGARRVFYTSHAGARAGSAFAPGRDHAETEDVLDASPVPSTALRHGFYAESALLMFGDGIRAGEIRAPEDGPVSWTARADLAAADAALLAGDASFEGRTPPLAASEALTLDDVAAAASEMAGHEVKRVVLSDEAWLAEKVAKGVPALMAEMLLGFFRAARHGDFAATDPTLEKLLGRRPRTVRDALAPLLQSDKLSGHPPRLTPS